MRRGKDKLRGVVSDIVWSRLRVKQYNNYCHEKFDPGAKFANEKATKLIPSGPKGVRLIW